MEIVGHPHFPIAANFLLINLTICLGFYPRIEELEKTIPPFLTGEEKSVSFIDFENQCKELFHKHCCCCQRVSITMKMTASGICVECSKLGANEKHDHYLRSGSLPVWIDDNGKPQYEAPECLTSLSMAEKMLIQLASPFIPLKHIKNGILGITGHVCAFEQDVEEFVRRLPRHSKDVTMLNVIKVVKNEIGKSNDTREEVFRVRRKNVLKALLWLKKYNREYKDIVIDMSNLSWMKGKYICYDYQPWKL